MTFRHLSQLCLSGGVELEMLWNCHSTDLHKSGLFFFFFSLKLWVSVESLQLFCLYLSSTSCLLLPVSALRSTTKTSAHYPACWNYIINKAANKPHASPRPRAWIEPSLQITSPSPHTTSYINSDSWCLHPPPPLPAAAQVRCIDGFLLFLCSY